MRPASILTNILSKYVTLTYGALFMVVLAGTFLTGIQTAPAAIPNSKQFSLAPVLKKVMPAVVNIKTTTTQQVRNPWFNDPFFRNFFPPQQRESSNIGSGVIINAAKGIIVTNNHVVAGASTIKITLIDGKTYDAELLGKDSAHRLSYTKNPCQKSNPDSFCRFNQARGRRTLSSPLATRLGLTTPSPRASSLRSGGSVPTQGLVAPTKPLSKPTPLSTPAILVEHSSP